MIRTHWAVIGALALLMGTAFAEEAVPAGTVKTTQGAVTVERAGARIPVAVGAPVFAADKLHTGADGSVGITLRDHTLLSAGPNTVLTLDRFAFDQTTYAGGMRATVGRGTLSVVTGKLAKQAPESVEFRTPAAILGVRGTEFAIEVARGSEE